MRTRLLLILATLSAALSGCNWMKEWRDRDQVRDRDGVKDLKDVTPEKLVAYLNDRAARLQSIQYENASMVVTGSGIPLSATLDGHLLCAQPRSFRLVGKGRLVDSKVIIGSNPEQFWVYVDVPREGPTYVYASHSDFESGRARLPNEIPFEPDWVMQALGMTTFPSPAAVKYTVAPAGRDRDRSYVLSWPATTPSKLQVIKEVVFDHNGAGSSRPIVKKHVIRDAKSNKVLASAEIKAVDLTESGADPRSSVAVQYPTHVVLRWEEQDFKMDLTLKGVQVNQLPVEEQARRAMFARPEIPGTKPINLVRYAEFRPSK